MENFICVQCGTQFDATATPPPRCTICEDERQFVHYGGQQWTTLARLAAERPQVLACMHGSAWRGDGAALLRALADSLCGREVAVAA